MERLRSEVAQSWQMPWRFIWSQSSKCLSVKFLAKTQDPITCNIIELIWTATAATHSGLYWRILLPLTPSTTADLYHIMCRRSFGFRSEFPGRHPFVQSKPLFREISSFHRPQFPARTIAALWWIKAHLYLHFLSTFSLFFFLFSTSLHFFSHFHHFCTPPTNCLSKKKVHRNRPNVIRLIVQH